MEFHARLGKECSSPSEREKLQTLVYWVTTSNGKEVTLVEKRSGCELNYQTISCCCSKKTMPISDIGAYLESAYASGMFKQLVLIGSQSTTRNLRHHLPEKLIPLVMTEIIEVDDDYLSSPNA